LGGEIGESMTAEIERQQAELRRDIIDLRRSIDDMQEWKKELDSWRAELNVNRAIEAAEYRHTVEKLDNIIKLLRWVGLLLGGVIVSDFLPWILERATQ
jgi:hypothetical protein